MIFAIWKTSRFPVKLLPFKGVQCIRYTVVFTVYYIFSRKIISPDFSFLVGGGGAEPLYPPKHCTILKTPLFTAVLNVYCTRILVLRSRNSFCCSVLFTSCSFVLQLQQCTTNWNVVPLILVFLLFVVTCMYQYTDLNIVQFSIQLL